MTPLSDSEARTVQRFENAEPAPESWGGELREAIGRWLMEMNGLEWDDWPELHATYGADADAYMVEAAPWLAALRAKVDAADRVRELHRAIDPEGYPEYDAEATAYCASDGFLWPCATIRALDGPPC